MNTNRAKILNHLIIHKAITKKVAADNRWTYGLGEHIAQLRKHHNIETVMMVNSFTGNRFAIYYYRDKKK